MTRFGKRNRPVVALRNSYYTLRIRLAGGWDRIDLYERWLGGFGSRLGAVRITGVPDFGSEPWLIHLGKDVTIADGVRFLTHDGAVALFRAEIPGLRAFGEIRVGSNVFLGVDAILLPNIKIGDNAIVGAGSVVTRNIESGTVVGGNPARAIKTVAEYKSGLESKSSGVDSDETDPNTEGNSDR